MEQQEIQQHESVDEQRDDQITDAEQQVIAQFARRVRRGDKMADIFGVADEQLGGLEAQAYRLYRNGQFSRAKIAGRGILALDEDRALSRLILGDIALEEHRFSDAVEHLQRASEQLDDQLAVRARLGEALLKLGKPDQARPHLEAVVGADSEGLADESQRCEVLLEGLDA